MRRMHASQRYLFLTAISLIIFFMLPAGLLWAAVPNAPSGLTATALSSTQIQLTWTDNATDETSFYIERKIGATGTYSQITSVGANVTTYTHTSLTQNTTYTYRIRAYNSSNAAYSVYSNETSATTSTLSAPTNLVVSSVSYTRVALTWSDNSGDETGFSIERKTGVGGTYSQVATVGANVTTYTNSSLTQGTEYYYRVRAYSGSNYSPYTNEVTAPTPVLPPPTGLTTTAISATQIQLTWTDNSTDETSFYIERKIGATGTYSQLTSVGANVTTYTNTGLTQNTEYYYRVRAYNSSNAAYSVYSNEASATTSTLNAPTNLAVSSASYTQVTLSWTDNSSDETGFSIERKTGAGGTYAAIYTTAANASSYTNTGLTQGTEYYYRVRAVSGSNYSQYTNEVSVTTPTLPPPSGLTATALSSTQIKLTWTDNSSDETTFYIERKTGATGTYSQLTSVGANVTTYTNTGLTQNTEYYYRVRAYNSSNAAYSVYSNEASATTSTLNAPTNLAVSSISYTKATLTWTDNSGDETGFSIERKTGVGGTYSQVATVGANVTTYTNTGLTQGTEYYYRVRAYSGSNYSPYTNEVTAPTPVIPPPSGLTAMALSSTQIQLTWTDNSTDETTFYIERKTGATGTYSQLTSVGANVTAYTNTGLAQNIEYYYRVRAYNSSNTAYSVYSNEASATTSTLSAPTNLSVSSALYTQVTLSWTDNSSDETGFSIERKTGAGGTYSQIATVGANVTTYTNTGMTQGTEYYYRVRAYSGSNYSAYTNEVTATTPVLPPPSGLTATALSSTQIRLTWTDNSSDETTFYIEYKTTGNYSALTSVTGNTTTYTHTSLTQNTTYTYRIRAYNSSNNTYSAYSNEQSATTLTLNAPSNLTATALSSYQIRLAWTDNSTDEVFFYIERKTGASGSYSILTYVGDNITTYTDSAISQNTEYYYRLRAYNTGGYSAYSNDFSAATQALNAPSNLTAAALPSSEIRLTWADNSSDETYFYIERKTGASGTYSTLASVGANVTTYTDSLLSQNTEYYYRVRAYNYSGYSAYSNEAGATTPILTLSAPSNLTAAALPSSEIRLTWTDNSSGETHFYIERKTGASGTYSPLTSVGANVTTYTDFAVTDNTEYYYRVRAYNNGAYSAYSNEAGAATPIMSLLAPSNLTAAALSSSQIRLTWTDTTAEEKRFYIERKTGASGTYSQLYYYVGANATTYTDYNLAPNTEYYYRIRAYGDGGYSPYSNGAVAATLPLNAPSNLTAGTLSYSQIRLTWTDNSSEETGFYIERKTGASGTYSTLFSVYANTTTYTDTSALHNTEYYYRVSAYSGSGYSAYSNEAGATTPLLILNTPSNLTATALSSYQIKLTWTDNSSDEAGFYIERKTGTSGVYYRIDSQGPNVTTFTDGFAEHNTEYYYRVRAYGAGAYSPYSNDANATTLTLNPPSNLTATALSFSQIKLTWTDNSSDEQNFYIERKTGASGTYSILAYVGENVTTYTDISASQNTEYYYRVGAMNEGGSSPNFNEVSATTLPLTLNAPSNPTATALSHSQIKLTWTDNSVEETRFYIERKIGASGTYTELYNYIGVNATTYTDYNLSQNTEYYYRVRAYGAGLYSAYSNEVSSTTLTFNTPSGLTAVPISCSEMKLTWTDNTTDETAFYIEYKKEGDAYWNQTYVYGNTTTYTYTGLVPGNKYYYRVRAYSYPNYSAYSNEASATAILPEGYELHSKKIALVPSADGRYDYGGTLPTTFNCYAPNFVNVSVESIRDNPTDPLVAGGYDTVALVGICDIDSLLSNNRFKSRIENFVSNGGKLIIWDFECRGTDYSKFVFPFITSNPGQMGSTGVLADLEENTLTSKNTLSDNYINVSYISDQTTAVGDANVLVTQDPNWCIDMTAENYYGVTGPVHTYAQYGKGLIIYDGFDKTDLYAGQPIGTADGVQNFGKIWMLELKQAWNPVPKDPETGNSVLPCLVPVVGIQLTPESATVPINKYHTLTAKVVDETWNPAPGVTVTFTVKSGPHAGTGGTGITDISGIATFSYKGIRAGVDSIEASATVSGNTVKSKTVKNEWIFALTDVRVIDRISNANITVDELSISPTPYSISQTGDGVEIEWRYPYITIGEIQDLSFSVDLLDPVPGEDRLVNQKLVVYYADVNGNPVTAELGPQYVHVLNSAFEGSISTDKPEYQPNENVVISASIKGHSEYAKTIDAKILIEDSNGALVKEVALLTGLNFSPGETKYFNNLVFNTGSTYAGNYRAHLILYDNQKETAEAFTDFAILPAKAATSSVTTDKVAYGANETVTITSHIRSESPNYIVQNLTAKVSLVDNQGRGLFTDSKTIPVLTPGGLTTFESNWNTSINPKGKYAVKLEVFEDVSVVSTSQTTFDILGTSQTGVGLTGTISAQPNPVNQGNSENLTYSVKNIGNEDMYNLAIKVLVVDPETQEIKHTFESTVNLNMAATISGQFVASTSNMQLKTYVVLLQYFYQGGTKTAATSSFVVKDGVAPVVSVVSPASGGTYTSAINIEVKATDDSSGVKSVEYQIDSGAWRLLPVADLLTGRYMTAWTPSQVDEGPHTIRFRATDRAGNTSLTAPVSFLIQMDNIPPQTTLTVGTPKYEANGRIYVTGNTTFTLGAIDNFSGVAKTEYRIDGGAWTPYALFTISGAGAHVIYYRSTDNAGNTELVNTLSVIVDNTPPSVNAGADIVVSAERDGTKVLTIDVTVAEPEGFDRFPKITWTENGIILGNSEDLSHTFGIGRHDLTLQAVDHLGNTASDSVTVTVMARQVGLTYTGDAEGQWSDTAVLSVHVGDITGAQAPVSLGGYGVVTFSIFKDDVEEHRYSVGATDSNGDAMTTHQFFRPDMPAGDYLVVVSFSDPSGIFAPATLEVPFRLNAEAGTLDYSGNQVVTVYDAGIQLQATLYQEEDETNGSLIDFDNDSNPVWVQFHIYKFTQIPGQDTPSYSPAPVRVRKSALHPSVGVAMLFVPLSTLGAVEENYTVTMSLTDWSYISSYPAESSLTVYNPDGRFFTGGGFILDPASGRHNNFGFTFKYNKQGKPQGNIVYIIRNEEEGTKTRIKSNLLTSAGFLPGNPVGTPTAIAEGKCNVAVYDLLTDEYLRGAGNLNFRLTVEDKGTSGIDQDTFYLRVLHSDGVPYEPADMKKSEILKGGNIVIHNTTGK